ncbi:hypothetical protein HMPREF1033_00746 [Tannerella sp. 6_1_58FAA_CT1]|nr:hypothetical protein HMPREF1033_00746 [Tannerella sp. 6_1_58FAA_CT1]
MVCLYFLYISTEKAVLDVLKVFYNEMKEDYNKQIEESHIKGLIESKK